MPLISPFRRLRGILVFLEKKLFQENPRGACPPSPWAAPPLSSPYQAAERVAHCLSAHPVGWQLGMAHGGTPMVHHHAGTRYPVGTVYPGRIRHHAREGTLALPPWHDVSLRARRGRSWAHGPGPFRLFSSLIRIPLSLQESVIYGFSVFSGPKRLFPGYKVKYVDFLLENQRFGPEMTLFLSRTHIGSHVTFATRSGA